jgi:hypothetical protein
MTEVEIQAIRIAMLTRHPNRCALRRGLGSVSNPTEFIRGRQTLSREDATARRAPRWPSPLLDKVVPIGDEVGAGAS